MHRPWSAFRPVLALGIVLSALAFASAGASADPNPVYPNAPDTGGGWGTQWLGTGATSLNYVKPAQQWTRLTDFKTAVDTRTLAGALPRCRELVTRPERCDVPDESVARLVIDVSVYPLTFGQPFRQSRFQRFPPMTVRTVAFGSIPVEAVLELQLPLGPDGLPVGLRGEMDSDTYFRGAGPCPDCYDAFAYQVHTDTEINGEVNIRVASLRVDNRPVEVGPSCRAGGAAIHLLGKGYAEAATFGLPVPPEKYHPLKGGLLRGTVTVPSFNGCGSSDKIDPLVSVMASGEGFPMEVVQAPIRTCLGATDPEGTDPSSCLYPGRLPFPEPEDTPGH